MTMTIQTQSIRITSAVVIHFRLLECLGLNIWQKNFWETFSWNSGLCSKGPWLPLKQITELYATKPMKQVTNSWEVTGRVNYWICTPLECLLSQWSVHCDCGFHDRASPGTLWNTHHHRIIINIIIIIHSTCDNVFGPLHIVQPSNLFPPLSSSPNPKKAVCGQCCHLPSRVWSKFSNINYAGAFWPYQNVFRQH